MFWKRFFSLFSCLVLLFAVFCIPASALEDYTHKVNIRLESIIAGVTHGQVDVVDGQTGYVSGSVYHDLNSDITQRNSITLTNVDGTVLFMAGEEYEILIENIEFDSTVTDDNGTDQAWSFANGVSSNLYVGYTYADGSYQYQYTISVPDSRIIYNSAKQNHSIKLKLTVTQDITKLHLYENMLIHQGNDFDTNYGEVYVKSGFTRYPMKLSVVKVDKTEGLLSSIISYVKNIFDKVADSFDTIVEIKNNLVGWFQSVVDAIVELPAIIWDYMENGLRNLFLPDESYITAFKGNIDNLLSSKFGAIYEVFEIISDSWSSIRYSDTEDSILLPKVTIPLPDGASFSFGGQYVRIVPLGFESLASMVKMATSMVSTVLFVNGMRKRYDQIVGG